MPNPLAPGLDVEAVKLKIQQSIRNPHVGRVVSVTLKNGPRTYRIGTLYEIQRGDGTYHHSCLRIDSVDRTKAGWHSKPAKSVSLDSDGDDEIERLLTFIQSARSQELPKSSGEYRVVPEHAFGRLRDMLSSVRAADGPRRFRLLEAILSSIEESPVAIDDWTKLFEAGSEPLVRSVSAAARMVEYRRAFTVLTALVEDHTTSEAAFQGLGPQTRSGPERHFSRVLSRGR